MRGSCLGGAGAHCVSVTTPRFLRVELSASTWVLLPVPSGPDSDTSAGRMRRGNAADNCAALVETGSGVRATAASARTRARGDGAALRDTVCRRTFSGPARPSSGATSPARDQASASSSSARSIRRRAFVVSWSRRTTSPRAARSSTTWVRAGRGVGNQARAPHPRTTDGNRPRGPASRWRTTRQPRRLLDQSGPSKSVDVDDLARPAAGRSQRSAAGTDRRSRSRP